MSARISTSTLEYGDHAGGDRGADVPWSERLTTLVVDVDGVLVDSRPQMIVALEESYRQHCGPGVPPSQQFFELMGMPLDDILRELGLPAAMADAYRAVSRRSVHLVRVFSGIEELLEAAQALGLRLGLLTGKDRARTIELLDRFDLSRFFEALVCGDDPFPGKPDPQGLSHLVAELGGCPAGAAFVGDSRLDMQCAVSARVLALGAEWGFSSANELRIAGAPLTFKGPWDLSAWLRQTAAATAGDAPWLVPAGSAATIER